MQCFQHCAAAKKGSLSGLVFPSVSVPAEQILVTSTQACFFSAFMVKGNRERGKDGKKEEK